MYRSNALLVLWSDPDLICSGVKTLLNAVVVPFGVYTIRIVSMVQPDRNVV